MATQVQWRGGSTAEHSTFTGAAREVTVDTQKKTLVVHDGSTAGGEPLLREDQANLPSSVTNGISVPSANNVAISTNGTQALYINADGDILVADGNRMEIDEIRARDGAGLKLYDDAGSGIFVKDGGNVGVGTTSPDRILDIESAGSAEIKLTDSTNIGRDAYIKNNDGDFEFRSRDRNSNGTFVFLGYGGEVDSEYARFDSSGRLLVGTSSARSNFFNTASSAPQQLQVEGTTGNTCSLSSICSVTDTSGGRLLLAHQRSGTVGGNTILNNGDQAGYITFQGNDGGEFVECASIEAVIDGTPGANDMPGRLVFSTTADGASSPTERMRITNGGAVYIGTTSGTFSTAGSVFFANGQANHVVSGDAISFYNRLVDDGVLISFNQDGTQEGTISVSGSTVSYNGAHLSRWSQLTGIDLYDKTARPEILRGTVMSNLDEMCDWTCPESGECQDNEQLNKTKISDVEGDKNVAGVFQSWDDDDDTWVNDLYLAMTGDFIIRIGAGVTVERGDLLMSAGDGTAKPQDDDIIRSKTIAKVTSTNVSCTYDDGSYCVPCVLMAC